MYSTSDKAISLLYDWLAKQIEPKALSFLDLQRQQIKLSSSSQVLSNAFSTSSNYTNKHKLRLTSEDCQKAKKLFSGWLPSHWTIEQAARTLLLLSFRQDNTEKYRQEVEQLFCSADLEESIALYQTLFLLPNPEKYYFRATQGIRSNIAMVFNAVALNNPYPAAYFDENAWNQMILKALFIGSQVCSIQGLDVRANQKLDRMLIDYACERRAAERSIPSDLKLALKNKNLELTKTTTISY